MFMFIFMWTFTFTFTPALICLSPSVYSLVLLHSVSIPNFFMFCIYSLSLPLCHFLFFLPLYLFPSVPAVRNPVSRSKNKWRCCNSFTWFTFNLQRRTVTRQLLWRRLASEWTVSVAMFTQTDCSCGYFRSFCRHNNPMTGRGRTLQYDGASWEVMARLQRVGRVHSIPGMSVKDKDW